MNFKRLVSLALLAILSASIQASELDLALSKETAAIELQLDTDSISAQGARLNIGGLYNEDDDLLGFIGLTSGGEPTGDKPYSLGVGVRLYYAAIENPDVKVGAVALGANGRVKFSAGVPLALAAEFYYAPKITAFEAADEVLDARIRFETAVSESATAFIGYRTVKLGLKSRSDYHVDDHVQLGVRLHF
ncbi:MAG: YfaZ family outer membrane protein [Thiotrichaceae bacterium]